MRMSSGAGSDAAAARSLHEDPPRRVGAGTRVARYNLRSIPRRATPFMSDFRQEFLEFALARDVLRFGAFVTKAGRKTPYF
jgi:hypothetical protein